jgi:hypothetical protein
VSGEAELRIECDRLLDSLEIVTTERDAALRQVALWQKTEGIARDSLEAARAQIAAALAIRPAPESDLPHLDVVSIGYNAALEDVRRALSVPVTETP